LRKIVPLVGGENALIAEMADCSCIGAPPELLVCHLSIYNKITI
jgi:hypothetical protein